jgi:hypothetical protein
MQFSFLLEVQGNALGWGQILKIKGAEDKAMVHVVLVIPRMRAWYMQFWVFPK